MENQMNNETQILTDYTYNGHGTRLLCHGYGWADVAFRYEPKTGWLVDVLATNFKDPQALDTAIAEFRALEGMTEEQTIAGDDDEEPSCGDEGSTNCGDETCPECSTRDMERVGITAEEPYGMKYEVKLRATRILARHAELLDRILAADALVADGDGCPMVEDWVAIVNIAKEVRL
jgi:hypothetical protein